MPSSIAFALIKMIEAGPGGLERHRQAALAYYAKLKEELAEKEE